jgi:HEAT repeat protein
LGKPAGVPLLSKAMRDTSRHVKQAAAVGLCRIHHESAALVLVKGGFWAAPDRDQIAQCVAEMKGAAFGVLKATVLGKGPASNKRFVCRVLGETKSRKAMALLKRAAKDKVAAVRAAACKALGQKGKKGVRAVAPLALDKNKKVRLQAVRALRKIGRPAVNALISALRRGKSDVRKEAAKALGEMKARRARRALLRATRDKNESVRLAACAALAKMGKKPRRCRRRGVGLLLGRPSGRSGLTPSDAILDSSRKKGATVAGVAVRCRRGKNGPPCSLSLKLARNWCKKHHAPR